MNIFIFHRDLRLEDNTSLIKQTKQYGSLIPIFILTPEQIDKKQNKYFSNNAVQFMIESLKELSEKIKSNNGRLYFFKGKTIDVLNQLHHNYKINSIGYNIDYTPYAVSRDKEINTFCKENKISVVAEEDYPLYNILDNQTKKANGEPYVVFTPFKNHCQELKVKPIDKYQDWKFDTNTKVSKLSSISTKELSQFYEEEKNINVHGGRTNALPP